MTDELIDIEPVAYRYGFDGYGWQYIDNGSGSDWAIRHPDAEPLYAHAQLVEERRLAWNEAIEAALAEVITDQTIDKHGAHCCCTTCELNVAEAGIRALTKDSTHD